MSKSGIIRSIVFFSRSMIFPLTQTERDKKGEKKCRGNVMFEYVCSPPFFSSLWLVSLVWRFVFLCGERRKVKKWCERTKNKEGHTCLQLPDVCCPYSMWDSAQSQTTSVFIAFFLFLSVSSPHWLMSQKNFTYYNFNTVCNFSWKQSSKLPSVFVMCFKIQLWFMREWVDREQI